MVEGPRMGMTVPLSEARPSYFQYIPRTLSDQRPFGPNGCGVGDRWPRLPRWHWAVGAPEGLDLATSPHHPPVLRNVTGGLRRVMVVIGGEDSRRASRFGLTSRIGRRY